LLLALGKSLYLASTFEKKCQYVLRLFDFGDMLHESDDVRTVFARAAARKDRLLGPTLERMSQHPLADSADIAILVMAKDARNYIAHEAGEIGLMQAAEVAESLAMLRRQVIKLAQGDNFISVWMFEIQEKKHAPKWMTQTYEARVLNWVFGDPFEEPDRGALHWYI